MKEYTYMIVASNNKFRKELINYELKNDEEIVRYNLNEREADILEKRFN
jgi:hypothetical protein